MCNVHAIGCGVQNVSAMPEKVVEVPLQEWLDALQKIQVSRHDMNRLIMNYLVTGKPPVLPSAKYSLVFSLLRHGAGLYRLSGAVAGASRLQSDSLRRT